MKVKDIVNVKTNPPSPKYYGTNARPCKVITGDELKGIGAPKIFQKSTPQFKKK